MKKIFSIVYLVLLVGCASISEKAQKTVDQYNHELQIYNSKISEYNTAAKKIVEMNEQLETSIVKARDSLNKLTAYDQLTPGNLRIAMAKAEEVLVESPLLLTEYEPIIISGNETEEQLKSMIENANASVKEMSNVTIPDIPEIPVYSPELEALTEAQEEFDKSVKIQQQITKPSSSFVLLRVNEIDSVIDIVELTEETDKNNLMNKPGGYVGCVHFRDSQVPNPYGFYTTAVESGTEGGGAIEIFASKSDAEARNRYLASFDTAGYVRSGSHKVLGTMVIRTSDKLTATQQNDLTDKIIDVLTRLD